MSLLRRLLQRALPGGEAGDGRGGVRDLLDEVGLPRRDSRQSLADRYGVTQHPAYQWEVIETAA